MEHVPSSELLSLTHEFPGIFQFKAIGSATDSFSTRVVEAVVAELESAEQVEVSIRETRGGKHVAVTMHVNAQSADQVRSIYAKIQSIEGLILLL